jgi:hypothetical protein
MAKGVVFGQSRFCMENSFYMQIFGQQRGELSVGKITNHVVLEGNHCWVVVMLEKRHVCLQNGL